MRYYRCKCGNLTGYGSSPMPRCLKCEKCGSDLACAPDRHREPEDHKMIPHEVETDEGMKTLHRCRWCGKTKSEIEKSY